MGISGGSISGDVLNPGTPATGVVAVDAVDHRAGDKREISRCIGFGKFGH